MTTIRNLDTEADLDEVWEQELSEDRYGDSPGPGRRRAWWKRPLLVSAAVLLVAEVGVRVLDPADPLVYSSAEAQAKADDLEALGRAGGVDTVFVGSSVADVAIDPELFAERAGVDGAYNAALLGSDLRSMEQWVEQVIVPSASPDRVVLALSCRELNGAEAAQDDYFRDFVRAPAMARAIGNERTLDQVSRVVGEWSALVHYRTVLRVPRNVGGYDLRSGENLELRSDGYNMAYSNRAYPEPAKVREVLFPGDIARFHVDPELVASLRRTLGFLRDRGIDAAVVHMPATEDWVGYLPSPDAFSSCSEVMASSAAAAGATFVDGGVLDRELFADPIHVNAAGTAVVTDMLAGSLVAGSTGGR